MGNDQSTAYSNSNGKLRSESTTAVIGARHNDYCASTEPRQIDDMQRQIGDMSQQIDETPRQVGDMSRQIGDMSRQMGDMSRQVGEMPRQVGDMSRQIGDNNVQHQQRELSPQFQQYHQQQNGRRRMSSCAVLASDGGGNQSMTPFSLRDSSLSRVQSVAASRAPCHHQSPQRVPSSLFNPHHQQQQEEEEEQQTQDEQPPCSSPPSRHPRALSPVPSPLASIGVPASPRCVQLPHASSPSAFVSRHFLLLPSSQIADSRSSSSTNSSTAPAAGGRPNRRMSVAGDQQDALRREMARAAGAMVYTSSGGASPQRRFSRATTSNCGAAGNSATASSLVTRKMSELAAGSTLETTVHEHLKLSSYQLHILQQSWPRIRTSGVFTIAFKDLCRRNMSAKEMFQKMSIVEGFSSGKCCDQKEHGRQLGELFEFTLQNLNGPSRIVQDRCYRLGEQHFTVFGTSNEAQLWDDLGESLSQALAKTESVRGKREAFRAWITLTNFLVESMRVGYTQQFKRRSLQRHSSSSQVVVQLATLNEFSSMVTARQRPHTPTVPLTTL